MAVDVIHYCQTAVPVPIRPTHIRQQLLGRSSGQGCASQHSIDRFKLAVVRAVQHNRKLVAGGNRQQVGITQCQRLSEKRISNRGKELHWLTVPCRAVNNGLAFGCKAGRKNRACFKRQTLVLGRHGRSMKQLC